MGSEMCIRDSLGTRPRPAGVVARLQGDGKRRAANAVRRSRRSGIEGDAFGVPSAGALGSTGGDDAGVVEKRAPDRWIRAGDSARRLPRIDSGNER